MIYERTEALGTLVRPTVFKAVEGRFIPSLVGSIPMRFRRRSRLITRAEFGNLKG